MILPRNNLDNSALFEQHLAKRLAIEEPNACNAAVDLSVFHLKSKIDAITISCPASFTKNQVKELKSFIGNDRVHVRRKFLNNRTIQLDSFIAVHDPNLKELRYLIEHFPECQVRRLEIATDATLPRGSNDLYLLRKLKEQLRHCVSPQMHPDSKKLKRKYFNFKPRRYVVDRAKYDAPLTTVIWEGKLGPKVSLYIKTIDNGKPVSPALRLEVILNRGSCCDAGLENVADFPAFALNLRRYCTPALYVARGFKKNDINGQKWKEKGSVWDIDNKKGLGLEPDSHANQAIGMALNELARSLKRLSRLLTTRTSDHHVVTYIGSLPSNDADILQKAA